MPSRPELYRLVTLVTLLFGVFTLGYQCGSQHTKNLILKQLNDDLPAAWERVLKEKHLQLCEETR
jgi:hypothetical protein